MDIKNILLKLHAVPLTQAEIAEELGCSQPSVSDMLSGKVGGSRPSYKIVDGLLRMSKKYGVDLEQPAPDHLRRTTDKAATG